MSTNKNNAAAAAAAAAAANAAAAAAAAAPTKTRESEIIRINLENENQKKLAQARNATPVYAFLYSDKRHCELWGLSQIEQTTMTFSRKSESGDKIKTREIVYVGKLASALMELHNNAKGTTSRGAIKPVNFWYIAKTGEYGTFASATQEDSDNVTCYVGGLMKKYLAGVAMIEAGKYREVKGFDSRKNKDVFGTFMRGYLNTKTDASDAEIDLTLRESAKSVTSATPVNMD